MLECKSGADILSRATFKNFRFFVLSEDKAVGIIEISKREKWKTTTLSGGGGKHYKLISKLRREYPESEGYQLDNFFLAGAWFYMVSNLQNGKHKITTMDRRFSDTYDFPEYINEKRNIVSLETVLPKFIEIAEKRIKEDKKYKHTIFR
jgi:hypothetical protein